MADLEKLEVGQRLWLDDDELRAISHLVAARLMMLGILTEKDMKTVSELKPHNADEIKLLWELMRVL